jgi:hypothetical protein
MKVYIAYEGYLDRHDTQSYNIIGVYTNEADAYNAVQKTITESGVEVSNNIVNGIPTTWWVEYGMDICNVGKLEEHELIEDNEI